MTTENFVIILMYAVIATMIITAFAVESIKNKK